MMQHDQAAGAPVVQVEGLRKSFGANAVLKGVDLTIRRGEVVVVMGPSGSGKTTFIRSLNFLEVPDEGAITICGTQVAVQAGAGLKREQRRRVREIRQKTAMVFQSFNLFSHMTVIKNIIEGPVQVKGAARTRPSSRRARCCARWDWPRRRTNTPAACPAARSSG